MCGIAGYLTKTQQIPDSSLIQRLTDRIAHRGPDSDGFYLNAGVALGHRRLSIIDLSTGDQPMGNEDGSIQTVFNGEIYNYLELRAELVARGHQFRTHSDTETLVHLYEDVGERMPEHLNGMFAFALWDGRKRELFLARDRFGEKPLYYTFDAPGLRFAFASELKALLAIPGFDPEVNERALADFLALSYVPDPHTIYRGVYKLQAGRSLLVKETGEPAARRYWQPQFTRDGQPGKIEDTIEELRALAADAVERRMISDVPLGAFLSGGVDSSAAVAFMAAKSPGNVKTFSIGFTSKEFDELEFARLVASRYHTEHHEQVVTPRIEEMLDTLVAHYDEPFGDSSAIPTLYLARMTRQRVTVALSGDGADEIFGGYRRYYFGALEHRLRARFPEWFRQSVIRVGAKYYPKFDYLPQIFRAKTLLGNLAQELGDAYFTSMSTFRDAGLDAVLAPELRGRLQGYSPRADFRDRFSAVRDLGPLEQMQAVDMETYLPGDILVKTDRATMAYSLEGRAPWLDHRIQELSGRLPSDWKIRSTVGKYVFKEAARPLLPQVLLSRKKMGFSVPLAEWFRTSLKPVFEAAVLRGDAGQYLSLQTVRNLWSEHQSGMHDHSRKLWNLLMFAHWDLRYGRGRAGSHAEVYAGSGRER